MNGFDDFDTQVDVEAVYQEDGVSHEWQHEDWQSQYDDDPSPYDGTYSEE